MVYDFITSVVQNFNIIDILDIVIVAYIIYRIILIFRQTRAVALIKGILALVIVTIIAEIINLTTLSWLLNTVWTVGILAFVILFQPELRRALEQFGQGGLLAPLNNFTKSMSSNSEAIDEVVKAAAVLSKNKIGALIVWERKTGIRDYIETGVPIDSIVSSSLLINIFIPNTPLHDGAVMIRNGRVVAAACYLPLTSNSDISVELGARHRSALGITECSDALVIVVSEETGAISFGSDGKLQRFLDTRMLKEKLRKALLEEPQEHRLGRLWRGFDDGK